MNAERHLLILRNGETDANAMSIVQRHSHVPLNEVGEQQARRLAARLAAYQPRAEIVISSDLSRAMQTAKIIAQTIEAPIIPDADWRERGLGVMEGQPFAEL